MAFITERLFTYVPSKVLMLGGEQWSRKIALGNQWSRVRLGFLGAIGGSASYNASYLMMGLCNNGIGGATAVGGSAIGACLSGSTITAAGAWTFNSNTGRPYYSSSASGKVYRRSAGFPGPFGASLASETSASITTVNIPASGGVNYFYRRAPVYFDITREIGGGGSATVTVWGPTSAAMDLDFRPNDFMDGLDTVAGPVLQGITFAALINTTIPISDMLGGLDTFFIMWQRTLGRLELSAIGASVTRPYAWDSGIGGASDSFSAYDFTGTALPSVLTAGSGFSAQAVFGGSYTNPGLFSGWAGTTGYPHDSFYDYALGTVVSDVTVSSGTGWAGNGVL
jgi:hypothetical protein